MHLHMYVCMEVCMCVCMHVNIYIYTGWVGGNAEEQVNWVAIVSRSAERMLTNRLGWLYIATQNNCPPLAAGAIELATTCPLLLLRSGCCGLRLPESKRWLVSYFVRNLSSFCLSSFGNTLTHGNVCNTWCVLDDRCHLWVCSFYVMRMLGG